MKEAVFIRQNLEKWKGYEYCLKNMKQQVPDTLADLYIDVTNDLSFARSHYPDSRITIYLNGLSSRLHQFIHEKKKWKYSQLLTFWTRDIPIVMYECRKELLYSFLILITAVLIGAFSSAHDDTYPRLIMGNYYVDMTLKNIANNDPMAVYKSEGETDMFWGIVWNNVHVSFNVFILGVFTSIASAISLIYNGIMLGSFHYLFFQHGLLGESLLSVWLHGTLEISAIVLAGCAGITMGNGWLFPKTYTRIVSFRRSARRGVKIIIGTVPVLAIAAFIESYLTRHTEYPAWFHLLIILLSLTFVIGYYVIYPRKIIKEVQIN